MMGNLQNFDGKSTWKTLPLGIPLEMKLLRVDGSRVSTVPRLAVNRTCVLAVAATAKTPCALKARGMASR